MPQYLAPGVYVEETSFRTGTIEGVSTSTAAFVGPTRTGPIFGTPSLLTCLSDFEAIYGSMDSLDFEDLGGIPMVNFMAQAVRAFFDNGGGSLYVSRTWNAARRLGHCASHTSSPHQSAGAANPYLERSLPGIGRKRNSGGDILHRPEWLEWKFDQPGSAWPESLRPGVDQQGFKSTRCGR